jgi:putative endonuclease
VLLRLPAVSSIRGERGARAEDAAAAHLSHIGFTVLERNARVGRLEIDIIARDGTTIALVEVRTRGAGAWTRAFESVNRAKQHRLRRAAHILWSRRFSRMTGIAHLRFDVAAVDLAQNPPAVELIKAAF